MRGIPQAPAPAGGDMASQIFCAGNRAIGGVCFSDLETTFVAPREEPMSRWTRSTVVDWLLSEVSVIGSLLLVVVGLALAALSILADIDWLSIAGAVLCVPFVVVLSAFGRTVAALEKNERSAEY
jgi:hypothetical protein